MRGDEVAVGDPNPTNGGTGRRQRDGDTLSPDSGRMEARQTEKGKEGKY